MNRRSRRVSFAAKMRLIDGDLFSAIGFVSGRTLSKHLLQERMD
jgi:hypothetical protein